MVNLASERSSSTYAPSTLNQDLPATGKSWTMDDLALHLFSHDVQDKEIVEGSSPTRVSPRLHMKRPRGPKSSCAGAPLLAIVAACVLFLENRL